MTDEKKYCEDCRFFVPAPNGNSFARCSNPKARPASVDHLIARDLDKPPFCSTMRLSQCGTDAAWLEQTETVSA